MYEIKTGDVYEDIFKDEEVFDFSNYSPESNYYNELNKLIVDKMKDKKVGVAIEEFIG